MNGNDTRESPAYVPGLVAPFGPPALTKTIAHVFSYALEFIVLSKKSASERGFSSRPLGVQSASVPTLRSGTL